MHAALAQQPATQPQALFAAYRTGQYAVAEEQAKAILEKNPSDAVAAELLGLVYLETGRHAEARRALKGFPKDAAGAARVLGVLAEVHFESGDLDSAEKTARSALELDRNALRARLVLAQTLIESGKYDDAIPEMEFFIDYYNEKEEFTDSAELTLVARGAWLYGTRLGEKGTVKRVAEDLFPHAIRLDRQNVDAFVWWGMCYYQKHDSSEARKKFEAALKLNRVHAMAHTGMALCGAAIPDVGREDQRMSRKELIRQSVERALQTNPRFVPALQLRAQQQIESYSYAAAKRTLAEALRVNPASQVSRGMLAACHFLLDEDADFERECKTAEAINPRPAKFYLTLADIVSTKLRLTAAHAFYERAAELDKYLWDARIGVGMSYLRRGEMELGTQYLKEAYARDPFHVWTVNTLKLLDSLETEYVTVSSSHFTFKFHKDEKETLPQFAVPLAERAFEEMSKRYNFKPRTPILVEVYPRHKDFSVRTFGLPGLGALGVCFGQVIAMDSPRAQEAMGPFSWGVVLWHEIAHVFHLQLSDFRVPRWFTEGLATYEEQLGGKAWGREKQLQILDAYQNGMIASIDSIDRGMTGPAGELTMFYLYGSLICEYIDKNFGFAKIVEMLNLWKRRMKTAEVIKQALGISTSELDHRMRVFLEEWLKDVKVRRPVDPMLLPALEAQMAQQPENSQLVAQVAEILIGQNKISRAEELLMRALERDPVSVECAIVAAKLFSEKLREDRAREFLTRAAALGADDFGTHFALGQMYLKDGSEANAIAHFELAKKALPGGLLPGANPYLALADIYRKTGEEEKEIKELEELVAIDMEDFKARKRLAKLYRKREKLEDVVRILSEAALMEVRDIELHAYLGEALRDLGRHEEAVVAFRATIVLLEAVNRDGKRNMLIADYYCKLAESYLALDLRDKALEAAKEARVRSPENAKAHELIKKLTE